MNAHDSYSFAGRRPLNCSSAMQWCWFRFDKGSGNCKKSFLGQRTNKNKGKASGTLNKDDPSSDEVNEKNASKFQGDEEELDKSRFDDESSKHRPVYLDFNLEVDFQLKVRKKLWNVDAFRVVFVEWHVREDTSLGAMKEEFLKG
ncbi:hypothetical protein ACH5RR_032481 [Cinchona calisaya]|uniref:Uncharacterized protein n=1 Tax=Cinchona calisaya TaxID=153742 RepID=A0ABD2YMC2_9GENT